MVFLLLFLTNRIVTYCVFIILALLINGPMGCNIFNFILLYTLLVGKSFHFIGDFSSGKKKGLLME